MDLQFHLQAFELMILSFILYEQKSWPCIFPSASCPHLYSLLPFLNENTKKIKMQQKQVTKSFLKENKHM